jgi:8-hydroxy-5-deazaflavin:NADPH oxidoreductase
MANNKIGILGSGQVAQSLAVGFIRHGYDVMVGSRDTSKLEAWQHKNSQAQLGSFQDAARFGENIVLAVKGSAAESLVKSLSPHLAGKVVLDTTNPIADSPPDNGVLKYFTTLDNSLMEKLQTIVPGANFVKVFSIVGNKLMVNPMLPGGRATMFICGNNEEAKKEVTRILDQFGWDAEDMGRIEAARAIEPLCMLWCIPGLLKNQWTHAFKLVKQ